jgi:hypothetical protein
VWQELIGLPIAHCSHSSGSAPRTQHTACMHPAPHLARLPAATHTQVRDHAHTPIALPQHQSMPLPSTCAAAPTHEEFDERQLDQLHYDERRLRQRRHGLRLVRRGGRAWMAPGGQVGGGWRLQRVCVPARGCARGGLAVGRPPPRRGARAAQNVSAAASRGTLAPPRMPRRQGSSARKGRTPRAPEPRSGRAVWLPSSVGAHENAISTSPPRPRQARQTATGACYRRHERRRQPQGGI